MSILIIGGGASGMLAAISAASEGATVTIYEHNKILGKKILQTGNGKCNISNRDFRTDYYNSNNVELLNNYFTQFDAEDAISSFKALGLFIKEKNGYLYPACEQASAVRDILELQVKSYNVEINTEVNITSLVKISDGMYKVNSNLGERFFNKVILACGSYAGLRKTERIPSDIDGYSLAYHLGHTIIPVKPALTQLVCKEDFFKQISGVRCECLISLICDDICVGTEYGELQITEYGISGIPVFQLSRHVSANPDKSFCAMLDFMPGINEEDFILMMQTRILAYQGSTIKDFFLGVLNNKLSALIISQSGLHDDSIINDQNEDALIQAISLIKCFKVNIKGTKSFENAQCCLGGVPLVEIDDDCQSVFNKGLYIIGEMLDVDGKCGGYNLQWAWTTGYIAGKAAAKDE